MGRPKSKHRLNKKEFDPLYVYINKTEKNRRKDYEQFMEHISDHLSIPKDVIAGQAMISMMGNHSVRICNYRTVEEYSTETIKLSLGKKSIVITGNRLLIELLRKEEIKVVGNIQTISFVN